jgi:uncharacterized peroxidase-related enzyme
MEITQMAVIKPVPKDEADSQVKEIYDQMEGKHGHMPNFFGMMAHRPAVLKSFLPLISAIGQGTVAPRYKELAYLKASMLNGCEYCTRAHTASAKRIGITDDQIRDLQFYRNSKHFDEKDKATILHAERVTRGAAALREGALLELKEYYTEDQIVELTLVICLANFTNRFNDATQTVPDLG